MQNVRLIVVKIWPFNKRVFNVNVIQLDWAFVLLYFHTKYARFANLAEFDSAKREFQISKPNLKIAFRST